MWALGLVLALDRARFELGHPNTFVGLRLFLTLCGEGLLGGDRYLLLALSIGLTGNAFYLEFCNRDSLITFGMLLTRH